MFTATQHRTTSSHWLSYVFAFSLKVGEVEHVYQVVNEDEYSDIVRKRQEEDWVIDDGKEVICSDLLL